MEVRDPFGVPLSCAPLFPLRKSSHASKNLLDAAFQLPSWKSLETSYESRLESIGKWLKRCRSDHGDCQPISYRPSRLVSVGLDGHPPRLVITEGYFKDETVEYAALSYCWGGM